MAGRIPQSFIDNLLSRTEIVDVIGGRVDLKKAGVNYKARCPFHSENTPSFIVNPARQFYHCYGGCGANGSAISFLMEYDHLSFPEAVEQLAGMAGLQVPREHYDDAAPSQSPLYSVLDTCSGFFQRQLKSHPPAIDYLKQRGLSGETAKHFGIGYAANRWDALESGLSGCSQADLIASGMLIENENGRIYDRFRDRITFPIRDRRGRTVGFGGRVMGDEEPKYLNSPETPVFRKGEELYGLFEARQSNRKLESLLVVEGYMDVIGLAQHGVTNAVATLGTATTAEHMQRLFRVVDEVVFCFDGDNAGRQAAWRALKIVLPTLQDGRESRYLFLAEGEDPDKLIRSIGKDEFIAQLQTALPTADFLFRQLIGDSDLQSVGNRSRLAEAAKPLIKSVPGKIYRTLLYQQLSELVGTSIADSDPPGRSVTRRRREPAYKVHRNAMRTAITLALQRPAVIKSDDLDRYDFDEAQPGGYVLQKLIGVVLGNPDITTAGLLENFRDAGEWDYLCQLAATDIPNLMEDDTKLANRLFIDSVDQLASANRRRGGAALQARADTGAFDDDLKAQLRAHFPYVD